MTRIIEKAHAKINISLDVVNKREDGYHNLSMIMQTVALHDIVIINQQKSGIHIKCEKKYVPSNKKNIGWKAADLFMKEYNIDQGVSIEINKRIPVAAGLAGGSADAAAILRGLRKLFDVQVSDTQLRKLGKKIGADVPYCITGGTMLAEGLGEILTPLIPLKRVPVLLVKPKIGVSTPWVFKNLDLSKIRAGDRPDNHKMMDYINNNRMDKVSSEMKNVLEHVTIPKYPIIKRIKKMMMGAGAMGSMMSGSGPSVFGIFNTYEDMIKASGNFNVEIFEVINTITSDLGGEK